MELLETKQDNIQNLHTVLNLVKTLALTVIYQEDNLPSTRPMDKMVSVYSKLTQQADTLATTNLHFTKLIL